MNVYLRANNVFRYKMRHKLRCARLSKCEMEINMQYIKMAQIAKMLNETMVQLYHD